MRKIEKAEAWLATYKLATAVGGSGVAQVDLIVVELEDEDGAAGLGFSYVLGGGGRLALQAAAQQLETFVKNGRPASPQALWRQIVSSFNRTGLGPNMIGLAAVDTACWDLFARSQEMPLYHAMGHEPRAVPIYGSGGFNAQQSPERAADVAAAHVERGLRGVKPRVSGSPSDAALLSAVQRAVGDRAYVMADANEKCDLAQARWLCQVAADRGVLFLEEPLRANALSAYTDLARSSPVTIAGGEHLQDLGMLTHLVTNKVLGVVQPDLAMIGGLSPVIELTIAAGHAGAIVSPHFLPGLFVQLAGLTNALAWVEEFPLLEPLFEGWPAASQDGFLLPPKGHGHGLALSETALSLKQA